MKNTINDSIPPKTTIEIHTIKAIIAIHDPLVIVFGEGVDVFGLSLFGINLQIHVKLIMQYSKEACSSSHSPGHPKVQRESGTIHKLGASILTVDGHPSNW
jgi:hypothetical protein